MNYSYLVPSNSKKQGLIFGLFKSVDLIIIGVGITITLIIFLLFNNRQIELVHAIIALSPGLIAAFLVFPIPNYHNVRTFIYEAYKYLFVNRKKYIWRGWCYKYEQSNDKSDEQSN